MYGDDGQNDDLGFHVDSGIELSESPEENPPEFLSLETESSENSDSESALQNNLPDENTALLPLESSEAADAAANELFGHDGDHSPILESPQDLTFASLVETNAMDPSTADSLASIIEKHPDYLSAVQSFIDENPKTYDQVFREMASELAEQTTNEPAPAELTALEVEVDQPSERDPVEDAVMSRVVENALEEIQGLSVEQLVRKHTQMDLYASERYEYHQYLSDQFQSLQEQSGGQMTEKVQEAQKAADDYWNLLQDDPKMIEIRGFQEAVKSIGQNLDSEEAQRIKPFLEIISENKIK
jgi:hypothetical protein